MKNRRFLSTIIISMLFTYAILFLNGCNTVHGFGQDVQQGGKEIQKASDES